MKIERPWNRLEEALGVQNLKRFGPNTSWMLAERILRIVSSFLVGIYLARSLGPADFGSLAYAQSFMTILAPVAHLGMDPLIIIDLIREPESRDRTLGTAFWLRIIGYLILCGILCIVVSFTTINSNMKWMILLVGIGGMYIPFQVIECHFMALVKIRSSVLTQMTQCILGTVLIGWGIVNAMPLRFFAGLEGFLGIVLLAGWIYGFNHSGMRITEWRFDKIRAKKIFTSSLPLALTILLYMIYTRIDHILIEHFLGTMALGWYVVPVRLTESCYFLPILITNSVFPGLVEASRARPEAYLRRLSQLYFLLTWLMVIAGLALTFLSYPIIFYLYGESYAPSAKVLWIYAWNVVPGAVLTITMKWLINEGHALLCMLGYAAGLVLNIGMLFIAIKSFGIYGAAVSTLISLPIGMSLVLLSQSKGRAHLAFFLRSLTTIPR